jgi:hypothetical protein
MAASRIGLTLRLVFSTSIALGALAAQADTVVYDAIPSPVPGNVPSLGPEAYSYKELGDKITLAAGPRALKKVDLLLSSWACQTGAWELGTCVTTSGATFTHPITLNIYDSDGVTWLGSVTQTFTIPYRPSANASCVDTKQWSSDGGTTCFNGLAHLVTFDSAALSSITLPDEFVFGVTYNTRSHGYAPIGTSGPYDSLNVGLTSLTNPSPSVGTDATGPDGLYWYTTYLPFYCDGGTGGSSFRLDEAPPVGCWSPYGGIDIRFVTAEPPTPVTLTGFTHPVDPAPTLNIANSGQAIPLKFYVADTDGLPITDLASVDVNITGVSCGTLETDGTDPIEQVAAGDSGLINQGNGYYQWNWKTTKGTTGCRIATLTLPDEYASTPAELVAFFNFKK